MAAALLARGHDVVIDAVNHTHERRTRWMLLGTRYGATVSVMFFDTPLEECLRRNVVRAEPVPDGVIERMHEALEWDPRQTSSRIYTLFVYPEDASGPPLAFPPSSF
jgi:predicted kinase